MPRRTADATGDGLTRRQLLQRSGGAGIAATISACGRNQIATTATSKAADPTPKPSPVPPPTQPRPVAKPTPALLLCRDAWGARPPRPGGRPHTISRMTLHHSGVVLGDNTKAIARLHQHQHYHQESCGWIDIAYHVGVDRNGHIYELRTPTLAGDTATDYDTTGHFLVVCEGDFDKEPITEAQLHSTAMAFAWASQKFGVADRTVAGHRDFASTACPGANLYSHLTSQDLAQRIEKLVESGGVDLQLVCGREAAQIVAAIESGLA